MAGSAPGRFRIGALDGLNRRQAVALRRGGIAIAARLDLHGFTRGDAARKVAAFLAQSAHRGLRCVLVITGQGRSDPLAGPRGVLRRGLEDWLNEPATQPFVLACVPARGRDGGQGAFYVLLRRGVGGGEGGSPVTPDTLRGGGRSWRRAPCEWQSSTV